MGSGFDSQAAYNLSLLGLLSLLSLLSLLGLLSPSEICFLLNNFASTGQVAFHHEHYRYMASRINLLGLPGKLKELSKLLIY